MTLSWPPAPGVSARWLAHARRLAALPEDAAAHAPVSQSGLDALCGAQQQPATVLAVIEILSAPRPALSTALAAAWCAAAGIGELGAARAKRQRSAAAANLAQALDPASGRPAFLAHPEGRSWRVQGGGPWIGAEAGAPLLVYAHHAEAGAVSAFLLPSDLPGVESDRAGPAGGLARVNLSVGPEHLLGPAGQARDAMLRTDAPLPLDWDTAEITDGPLCWVARDSAKPGRQGPQVLQGPQTWVLHASARWSQDHIESDAESVARQLLQAFEALAGSLSDSLPGGLRVTAHRWRYALPAPHLVNRCWWDAPAGLGLCGDWCIGRRVEDAFVSGLEMALAMVAD